MGSISWWHWAILALLFIPKALYLRSVQKTLAQIPENCRTMKPGLVWLSMIPILYFVWNFVVVSGVRNSLRNLHAAGGLEKRVDGGYVSGILSSICGVLGPLLNVLEKRIFPDDNMGDSSGPAVAALGVFALAIFATWLVGWSLNWSGVISARKLIHPNQNTA